MIGGPFNSGILATGPKPGAYYNYAPAPPDILERVRAIEAVCKAHGVKLAEAALRFPLSHPAIVSVIPGGQKPSEVRRNAEMLHDEDPGRAMARPQVAGTVARRRADAPLDLRTSAMLKHIDPLLNPDLLQVLRQMGHGDEIAIVDANFPAYSQGPRVVRLDGVDATRRAGRHSQRHAARRFHPRSVLADAGGRRARPGNADFRASSATSSARREGPKFTLASLERYRLLRQGRQMFRRRGDRGAPALRKYYS